MMNIKKTKLALTLTGALFLALPISQAFAHESHCEIKDTELGDLMKYMKSELRGYVKGFKSNDQEKMQKHLNELLILSEKAHQLMPVTVAQMSHTNMDMEAMDHGKMDHANMDMKAMDHDKMDHANMDMKAMDHGKMDHANMDMKAMDHGKMDHANMDMKAMDHADHDMSTMPSMQGMSAEQHHQHLKYMQGMEQLQTLFKGLNETKDATQIKTLLGKIKEHSKKSHQQFRQDCP